MFLLIIVSAVGLVVGAVIAGGIGGLVGALAGFSIVSGWLLVREGRIGSRATPERETARLICIPNQLVAETLLLRDPETGEYLDVAACSVFETGEKVTCEKNCLLLMNDAAGRKGKKVPATKPAEPKPAESS